jgi:hypothetical protein
MQRRHFMKSAIWGSAGIMAGLPVLGSKSEYFYPISCIISFKN